MAQCSEKVEKPKKPASSFFLFLKEKHTFFVEQADGNYRKGVSDAAKAWKLLSPEEKALYDEMAKEKLKEYLKDMENFKNGVRIAAGNDDDKSGSGENKKQKPVPKTPAAKRKLHHDDGDKDGKVSETPKKQKDTDAPKKPVGGAYGCYMAANKAKFAEECKGKPVTAVAKMASEKWKSLSEEDRKPFEEEYKEKKTSFDADMAALTAKSTNLTYI